MNVHEKFRKRQNVSPYPFSPYEKGEFSARKDRSPLKWTPTATNNPFVVEWQMEEPIPVKGISNGPAGNVPGSYF